MTHFQTFVNVGVRTNTTATNIVFYYLGTREVLFSAAFGRNPMQSLFLFKYDVNFIITSGADDRNCWKRGTFLWVQNLSPLQYIRPQIYL